MKERERERQNERETERFNVLDARCSLVRLAGHFSSFHGLLKKFENVVPLEELLSDGVSELALCGGV